MTTLQFGPCHGSRANKTLVVSKSETHLVFDLSRDGEHLSTNISHADAQRIRDELLKLFPLTPAVEPKAPTYNSYLPEVGAKAQAKASEKEYFTDNGRRFVTPFTVYKVEHTRYDALVFFKDANGVEFNCFSTRLEAYVAPAPWAKPAPEKAKWETVADGMDRLKIDGGYLYQNDSDELAFVPDQPKR